MSGAEFDAIMYGVTDKQKQMCENNTDIVLTGDVYKRQADTQDRLVPSDMVLQEPFLKQTLNTDQFLKLLDSLHVIHV